MQSDSHERACFLIDESRVGGISQEETWWLRRHLSECPDCARHEEITDRMVHALGEFSMVGQISGPTLVWPQRKADPRVRWLAAAAVTILLIGPPLYKASRDARQERSDALLLERVEAGVSRHVPAAMTPLMQPDAGENR